MSIEVSESPFQWLDVSPRGLIGRLLRGVDQEAVTHAIENLFVGSPPEAVTRHLIESTLKLHGIKERAFPSVLLKVYGEAVRLILTREKEISQSASGYLNRLGKALGLTEAQMREHAEPVFKTAVENAVSNRALSDEDSERLSKLGAGLRLTHEDQSRIASAVIGPIINTAIVELVSDHRLTPEKEQKIDALATQLKIDISNLKSEPNLVRFRMLARIDAGEYPVVAHPSVALQKNEQCNFTTSAEWHEVRRVTQRIAYSGISTRIRIVKGVYWNAGSFKPQRVSRDVLTPVDSGDLFLTTKRIIFRGNRGNKVIPYTSVLGFEVYSDGFKIEKSSGKPPYLLFSGDAELAAAILNAHLNRPGA